ncbi:unnamed protein product [Sympodiomycopsis kandeliae]
MWDSVTNIDEATQQASSVRSTANPQTMDSLGNMPPELQTVMEHIRQDMPILYNSDAMALTETRLSESAVLKGLKKIKATQQSGLMAMAGEIRITKADTFDDTAAKVQNSDDAIVSFKGAVANQYALDNPSDKSKQALRDLQATFTRINATTGSTLSLNQHTQTNDQASARPRKARSERGDYQCHQFS